MEDNIEKINIIKISEVKNINKKRLGLKKIQQFNLNEKIFKLSKFPSGNFVSIKRKNITIWNNNFNKIQKINYEKDYKLINKKKENEMSEEFDNLFTNDHNHLFLNDDDNLCINDDNDLFLGEHNNLVLNNDNHLFINEYNNLFIRDDNNFGIIYNTNILLYLKKNDQFNLNEIIYDADNNIKFIFFYLNKLISCSNIIKFWKKEKNKYQCSTTINMNEPIYPICIEKDNFFIATKSNIFIFNLIEEKIIYSFKIDNNLDSEFIKINDDVIVESLKNETFLISIKQQKIINKIKYNVFAICSIKNHDFFLGGGKNHDIRFFNINNGECFTGIETFCKELIAEIIELNDGSVLSYTKNGEIQIWKFDLNYVPIY